MLAKSGAGEEGKPSSFRFLADDGRGRDVAAGAGGLAQHSLLWQKLASHCDEDRAQSLMFKTRLSVKSQFHVVGSLFVANESWPGNLQKAKWCFTGRRA